MKIKLLCERYVDAFIACYDDDSKVTGLESLLPFINKFETDSHFKKILLSSSIKFEQKVSYISKNLNFDDKLIKNFICLILKKERSILFTEMKDIIFDKILSLKQCLSASIVTPLPLEVVEKVKITKYLKQKFNKDIQVEEIIDESMIAGFKIYIQNKVFDLSVVSALKKLKYSLK